MDEHLKYIEKVFNRYLQLTACFHVLISVISSAGYLSKIVWYIFIKNNVLTLSKCKHQFVSGQI